jgi:hypothetical protein
MAAAGARAKEGTNIALNAPVMITYPTALALTAAIVAVGLPAILAALVVSAVVYALDWASREGDWDADDYTRRLVYLAVNTLILWLTVSGVLTLNTFGLG